MFWEGRCEYVNFYICNEYLLVSNNYLSNYHSSMYTKWFPMLSNCLQASNIRGWGYGLDGEMFAMQAWCSSIWLSSIHMKSWAEGQVSIIPVLGWGGVGTDGSLGLTSSQSSWIGEFQAHWKTSSQNIRSRVVREDTQCQPLVSTHAHMCIYVYTHKHMYTEKHVHTLLTYKTSKNKVPCVPSQFWRAAQWDTTVHFQQLFSTGEGGHHPPLWQVAKWQSLSITRTLRNSRWTGDASLFQTTVVMVLSCLFHGPTISDPCL